MLTVGCKKPEPAPDGLTAEQTDAAASCERTVSADVAVINQQLIYNRLGAVAASSQIFAMARDIEVKVGTGATAKWQWLPDTAEWKTYAKCRASGDPCTADLEAVARTYSYYVNIDDPTNNPRQVRMRQDHRPRPLVLRANVGDCLEVNLVNLLPTKPEATANEAANTNYIGFHPVGMELVDSITNDGQIIGANPNSVLSAVTIAPTGQSAPNPGVARQYKYYASHEAVHFVSSSTDTNDGQLNAGLFGAVHVQPRGAEWYRSQVTQKDLADASGPPAVADGPPTINYQATFDGSDPTRPWKGADVPILAMTRAAGDNRVELLYGDITAIITGPNAGAFTGDSPVFNSNPANPSRRQPYREFTIIYHEPGGIAQAFPEFFSGDLSATTNAGQDLFGINYGTGGIGAEILANRLAVGPMADCADCRYEEFFLSAWTVGDPAMVPNITANHTLKGGVQAGQKAGAIQYPDDPSNVYHSYIGDHVKMRVHHGGAIHHLHHLHAHQWLHSPNSDDGHYLDSQLIGPGSSFNLEIAYNGSGNRNQTVGDSIFHCHFYPHFAEGMWAMWRVHDVFEAGTELEVEKIGSFEYEVPKPGSRALPDGEVAKGTPIPGLVPMPTLAMPPMPSKVYIADGQVHFGTPDDGQTNRWGEGVTKNPGFPFFIPGEAGSRPPHPPKDFAVLEGNELNGGLPRHLVRGGSDIVQYNNKYDFSRFANKLEAVQLPEEGLPIEQVAMQAHATRLHDTSTPEGTAAKFVYNGLPPQQGAPFADPCYDYSADFNEEIKCLDDPASCTPRPITDPPTTYRGADIQHDVVLNKDGWHYPQQRLAVLWQDIQPTFDNQRPPQPFFFRANSRKCIEFWLTNLVPDYYEVDNFQVRTPTDILGQHIHLVKFDVTSSDGAANGWNYEDGTFSYEEVEARIDAINANGGLPPASGGDPVQLAAQKPTYLCDPAWTDAECTAFAAEFPGAQTTVQRWWADPLLNNAGFDRTIRTVFTHDHFGPSTHQQAGLYAGLLVEPEGSEWYDAETGEKFHTRPDGGPTSWQAVIKAQGETESYREFALEFQDLALAYAAGGAHKPTPYPPKNKKQQIAGLDDKLNGIPTTNGKQIRALVGGLIYDANNATTPAGAPPIAAPETPQLISAPFNGLPGTYTVNYRHEPLAFRANGDDSDAAGEFKACEPGEVDCDNAYLYASIEREYTALNSQHVGEVASDDHPFPPALTTGAYGWDPFTPLLRAYEGERVQVRTLVGAHVQMHNLMIHGFNWLFEPSNDNSGYRDSQSMGISEHFEMEFTMPPATRAGVPDSAGEPTVTTACESSPPPGKSAFADYLYTPSSAIAGQLNGNWGLVRAYEKGTAQCLHEVPGTPADVGDWKCPGSSTRELRVAAHNTELNYYKNSDGDEVKNPYAMAYTGCDATLDPSCKPPAPGAGMDPLVLRVKAGECVHVTLDNAFDPTNKAFTDSDTPLAAPGTFLATSATFGDVTANPSVYASLHPQMLAYDGSQSSGLNVGFNQKAQAAKPGDSIEYTWYAGIVEPDGSGRAMEFGVVNLLTADPLLQSGFGLVGALVVEPADASWTADQATSLVATVESGGQSFTDIVLITLDGVAASVTGAAAGSVVVLTNYGTEPIDERFENRTVNFACQYSNRLAGDQDPQSTVYAVEPGSHVRFRVVHPWGNDQQVFELFGHLWQEEPFADGSVAFGNNTTSEWQGFRAGWGSTDRLDVIVDSSGGPFKVPGDYLYRLRDVLNQASNGVWGLYRVGPQAQQLPIGFCIDPKDVFAELVPAEFDIEGAKAIAERTVPAFIPRLPAPVE